MVLAIYVYSLGHIGIMCVSYSRFPGPRHARLIPAALILIPLTYILMLNDPVTMMRVTSVMAGFMLILAAVEFTMADLLAARHPEATTDGIRLIHGTEMGVYVLMLVLSELAIALGGGWYWIAAAATFRLAGRRMIPAMALRLFKASA